MNKNISGTNREIQHGQRLDDISKKTARERRDTLIKKGFTVDSPALLDALPAVGKSFGVIKWAAETGSPISIFTERHELYDQYEEWAENDFHLTSKQLPVFHEDCPTVEENEKKDNSFEIRAIHEGDGPEEWRKKVRQKYDQGVSGRELHNRATEYFGENLPCQKNGSCPYIEALDQNIDDVDVLIGNFRQVFVEQHRKDRYIVFDEFPKESFIQEFLSSTVSNTVTRYVSNRSDLPFDNWKEVLNYDLDTETHSDVKDWLDSHSYDRATRPLYRGSGGQIDARGPLLTEITLRFSQLSNNWQRVDLGEGRIAVQSPNNSKLSLLDPPPTEGAEGIVALDGTPCMEMWQLLLGENLTHLKVFTEDQKREFLRDVLELQFIKTRDSTKPYHSGRNVNPDEDMAFIEFIKEREDRTPSIISSLAAIEAYEQRGIDKIANKTENYNNLKGSGEFGTDRLGVVIGCPQPSDDYIELWGALAGESITRLKDENGDELKGVDLDFGRFGNRILKDVRENEVLQAAMRFGREEAGGERGAIVYVHTAALPAWVQPESNSPNIHAWPKEKGVAKVVDAIKELDDWQTDEWKKSDIIGKIDSLTSRRVAQILQNILAEEGYIDSRRGGRGNAHIWSNICLEDLGEYGLVEW